MSATVTIKQGRLQGKQCMSCSSKSFYSFEGIPYAKPPVGRLRFRDPQPPESWAGVRDATEPGNRCAQLDPSSSNPVNGSEDCLYLNVYTPCLPSTKLKNLPVVVFVHGGRFVVGHGAYYRPEYFMEHDVILVTINYRLHILGFLCLHTPEVPGNAALKDTIMALRWVKENVSMFNGNPNNITAMGESAGAGLVTTYVTSKIAYNLFDKIIGQSGVSLSDLLMIEEDPIAKARQIASILGKDFEDTKDLYQFLMDAPVEDLVFAVSSAEVNRPAHIINAFFLPVVEKEFDGIERYFDEYPLVTLKQNRQKKVPILLGLSSHEGALFLRKDSEGKIEYITDTQLVIPRFLSLKYNSPKSVKLGRALHQFYFQNREVNDQTKEEYLDLISDAYFNRDIIMFTELYTKGSNELYLYNFSYSGNMHTRTMENINMRGASHGDIVQYQFYKKAKDKKANVRDKEIVAFLSEAWCNFAKTGKPTWRDQKFEWSPYTTKDRLCVNIDEDLTLVPYPGWPRVKVWIDNMGERSKL